MLGPLIIAAYRHDIEIANGTVCSLDLETDRTKGLCYFVASDFRLTPASAYSGL